MVLNALNSPVTQLRGRVRGVDVSARFREVPCGPFAMPVYEQLDDHSCGFLAVLAVVRYFLPCVDPRDVLEAVQPSPEVGCGQDRVLKALRAFGITATFRDRLGMKSLAGLVQRGLSVIVTVWPEDYCCDHWTAVRWVNMARERIHLTNCEYAGRDGGMPWAEFGSMWHPHGCGIVCSLRVGG